MSVTIEIAPADAHAEAPAGIRHAGLLRHLLECAVSSVAIEGVARAGQPSRSALNRDAVELTELSFAELGQRVEPHVDVVGHVEVEPAVAVVIGERRAGRPPAIADARLRGDVSERSIRVVAVEVVRTVTGHVQIVPAVVVEVGSNGSHPHPG